jgi:hypothetical protein
LTSAERAELAGLKAWLAAAPDSLKAQVDDPELREFLVEDVWGGGREAPAQPAQRDEDSAGHRKLAKRHAPAKVTAPSLPQEDETPPDSVER